MTLLPFDLQKALAGHPCGLEDGRKVLEMHYFQFASDNFKLGVLLEGSDIALMFNTDGELGVSKLFLFAPEPQKMKFHVNFYKNGPECYAWPTRELADANQARNNSRIACKEIEVTEGEGLENVK